MCLVMNEVVIRDFEVLRWAIDAESQDLAIWTTPGAQNPKIRFVLFNFIDFPGFGDRQFRFPYNVPLLRRRMEEC